VLPQSFPERFACLAAPSFVTTLEDDIDILSISASISSLLLQKILLILLPIEAYTSKGVALQLCCKAVYEGERSKAQSASTLHMASCLYAVGEAFLKARLFRESIRHMEKCIAIFQEILGSHIDVARSLNLLSKGCLKLGDSESALAKLEEAKAVYEQCDAMVHYEAIANSHHMATLYLDTGNWDKASLEYQNVMTMKSNLYGGESLPVAKALNEFAVILAKNNRLSEALQRYEGARTMYESISKQSYSGLVFIASLGAKNAQHKFLPDVTLIDLNIASLNSKLSNYQGALKSYERGVAGLRLQLKQEDDSIDKTRQVAQRRHLVSAIARIGSLRMKLKDNSGALKAYMVLIQEVDHTSPTPSQMEKAKAHVKCATIFRQSGGKENNENAVSQLELALQMYTILHGQNHKDTKAIASSLRQWQRIDSAQPRG
jgi:tetratricopeptide (TPR) repeat protein